MKFVWYLEVIWNARHARAHDTVCAILERRDPFRRALRAMVRFTLRDGLTLEIHVPEATAVEVGNTKARVAGFVLRRGREVVNVGVLARIVRPHRRTGPREPC